MFHWVPREMRMSGRSGRLLSYHDMRYGAVKWVLRSQTSGTTHLVALPTHSSPGSWVPMNSGSVASTVTQGASPVSEAWQWNAMMKESPCVLAGHDCTTDCNRAECERHHVCSHVGVTDGGKSLLNFASISARIVKRDGHPCQAHERGTLRIPK